MPAREPADGAAGAEGSTGGAGTLSEPGCGWRRRKGLAANLRAAPEAFRFILIHSGP